MAISTYSSRRRCQNRPAAHQLRSSQVYRHGRRGAYPRGGSSMVSARELRDMFEEIRSEAGKRATDFVNDAKTSDIGKTKMSDLGKMKMSDFGRRSEPPGI